MNLFGYIILAASGIVFALAACAYMNMYEVRKYKLTDNPTIKNVFVPVSRKRKIYEILGVLALVGLGIEMRFFFPTDAYVHQIKTQFLISVLFALAFIDYRYKIVPNKVLLFCLGVRMIFLIFELIFEKAIFFDILKSMGIGVLVFGVFLFVCTLITKGGIGMGDIKLFMIMVLYQGFTNCLASVSISMILCFVLSVILIALKKKKIKDTLPLVPSILAGTFISVALTGM